MVNNYKFENVNYEKLKFSWWLSLIQKQTIKSFNQMKSISMKMQKNKENCQMFYAKYHENEKRKKYTTF